jgi:enoyl-[acyl-carrier protein] reductase I
MGILDGKRILVTGVLTDSSIAFHVARLAQQEGATVVLTGFGRLSLVERIARRLPDPPPVLELDVADQGHLGSLAERVSAHTDRLDGVVHAIAFAPQSALGGNFLNTEWADVATAVQVSAYSLKALAMAALPLMGGGGAIVGLDFDASVAWPAYDWMGVAKAGLESCARYLARDLGPRGIRVNLVASGRCARWRPAASPASPTSRRRGRSGRRWGGTSPIPGRPRAPASRCCPTGSRPPPGRSSTPTAAPTRSADERAGTGG